MAISDIFSSTFLISLAITFFIASMLYIYISNKFAEQNHKINSMFSLISTMAEEQQYFRAKLIGKGNHINNLDKAQFAPHLLNNNNDFEDNNEDNNELISVSDNQDQDEYYTSESEYDDDDDDDDDDNDYDIPEQQQTNNIDILNLGLINQDNLGLNENNDSQKEEVIDIDEDSTSTINLNQYNIKTIHLEDPIIEVNSTNELDLSSEINLNEGIEITSFEITQDNDNDTINTTNTLDNHSKQEYKKMSINKLREVIVEKGLLQDASKLKKNEILKMLGDE
jgi:hypothetical protein